MPQNAKAAISAGAHSWADAVKNYRAAEKALSNHPYIKASPTSADYERLRSDHARFLEASAAAFRGVLCTPASDLHALAEKIGICADQTGEDLTAIRADAERLGSDQGVSLIMLLHQRYERAVEEYDVVDKAESLARQNGDEHHAVRYQEAMRSSIRETDALRVAILHQVPDIWVEAMLLQFHIANAFDMQAGCEGPPPVHDQNALHTAIDTLFDFMCCEIDQDYKEIGPSFRAGAVRVFQQRRYRTGDVEG